MAPPSLRDVPGRSVARLMDIARSQGWEEVVYDCRDELGIRAIREDP